MADNKIGRQEALAISDLKKAVELQSNKRPEEAEQYFEKGGEALKEVYKNACQKPKHRPVVQKDLEQEALLVMADNKIIRQEVLAISDLKKAVELELQSNKRPEEAEQYFEKGEKALKEVYKTVSDACQLPKHRAVLQEFLDGGDIPKDFLKEEQEASKKVERIKIKEDSVGHSYETLFGHYLNKYVTEVEVDDPYIQKDNQIEHFASLCELIVQKKIPVKTIILTTKKPPGNAKRKFFQDLNTPQQQDEKLDSIRKSLEQKNIELRINYSATLHDREIRLNTGWIINIGRGLDYLKDEDSCRETIVHIFKKDSVKPSTSTS